MKVCTPNKQTNKSSYTKQKISRCPCNCTSRCLPKGTQKEAQTEKVVFPAALLREPKSINDRRALNRGPTQFCCCDKILTKNSLGREAFILSQVTVSHWRKPRQELKQQPGGMNWSPELLTGLLTRLILVPLRSAFPGGRTTHSGLGPVMSIINQENAGAGKMAQLLRALIVFQRTQFAFSAEPKPSGTSVPGFLIPSQGLNGLQTHGGHMHVGKILAHIK